MIERTTREFTLQGHRYTMLNEWTNTINSKQPFRSVAPMFSVFYAGEELTLLTNYANGLLFSGNILEEGKLSEINTDRFYPTSIDFISHRAGEGHKAVVAFNSGSFITFNPKARRKETNQWYHVSEPLYSKRPPVVARWVSRDPSLFVVVFEDGLMWKFSTRYQNENRKTAEKMLTALRDSTSTSFFQVVNPVAGASNPLSLWRFRSSRVKDLRFVPTTANPELQATFAICTSEGSLIVFDLTREVALIEFKSYFAGFLTLAWSSDSRYIVTGGEDDCVCVWSTVDYELVARGEEHKSWVSSVAFDIEASEADPTLYRFYSASQDGRLAIWEFSPMIPPQIERQSLAMLRRVAHPPIDEAHRIDSVANYKVSDEPLSAVVVEHMNVLVGDTSGRIRHWRACQ